MDKNRQTFLWVLFLLQLICSIFFVIDIIPDPADQAETSTDRGDILEIAISLCLFVSTLYSGWELRRTLKRETRMRQQLDVASGAFAHILQTQFDAWRLTEAERDIALLGIKGYSIAEIAKLRDTKEGTVKAQNAAVYRKAGVSGRLQLLSHFIEDLMGENLISTAHPNTS